MRQTKADNYRPELYVVPNRADDKARVLAAVQGEDRMRSQARAIPASRSTSAAREIHVTIPDALPRRPRGALRAGDARTSCGYLARPQHAARVGAAEHAREILRDDDGRRAEPAGRRAKPAPRIAP